MIRDDDSKLFDIRLSELGFTLLRSLLVLRISLFCRSIVENLFHKQILAHDPTRTGVQVQVVFAVCARGRFCFAVVDKKARLTGMPRLFVLIVVNAGIT